MPTALRLMLALLLTAVPAPALADYTTCMTHCMTQHQFDQCHGICARMAPSSPPAGASAANPDTHAPSRVGNGAGKCNTVKQKMDAIKAFIGESYGDIYYVGLSIFAEDDGSFDLFFDPDGESCGGTLTVDENCQIGAEGIRCEPCPGNDC